MKKGFAVITLGCRTNQYETQGHVDQLRAIGYEKREEGADLCIVNTCTVTHSADQSSKKAIRDLRKLHPKAKIVVTGCLAEGNPDLLRAVDPDITLISNKNKEQLLNIVLPDEALPEFSISQFDGHTRAFVKVQDGCNSFCSYCIIPYVRGRSRSRKLADIVQEIRGLIENGYKEIVLTGINIGDWDGEENLRLSDLVRACDSIEGLLRLRLSSIDADEVDRPLLEAILGGKNTCHSLHIVLQSGANTVLKRMNRKYSRQQFLQKIEEIHSHSKDFCFTTDIIYAFPGESEEDFEETLEVIREVGFVKVHFFPFSPRERTKAFFFSDRIPHDVVSSRKARLKEVSERAAFLRREDFVGKTMTILTEGGDFGHSSHFLPVSLPPCESNEMRGVKIVENRPDGLRGIWE